MGLGVGLGCGEGWGSLSSPWGGIGVALSLLAGGVGGDPLSPRALGPEESKQLVPRLCPQCPPDSWYLHPLQNPQNSRGDPKKQVPHGAGCRALAGAVQGLGGWLVLGSGGGHGWQSGTAGGDNGCPKLVSPCMLWEKEAALHAAAVLRRLLCRLSQGRARPLLPPLPASPGPSIKCLLVPNAVLVLLCLQEPCRKVPGGLLGTASPRPPVHCPDQHLVAHCQASHGRGMVLAVPTALGGCSSPADLCHWDHPPHPGMVGLQGPCPALSPKHPPPAVPKGSAGTRVCHGPAASPSGGTQLSQPKGGNPKLG